MPYYERDGEGKLVPITVEVSEEVIRAIDRYDEEAIVRKMTTGIASEEYIYRYPIQTKAGVKEIIGISADGSDEIALMLGNIEVLQDVRVDKDSDPDYFYGMVRARDVTRNVTLLGAARQCKYMVDAGNKPIHERLNEHAFVSAISKAQRNAILHLTPEEVVIKIIDSWSKRGKSKQIVPPRLEVEPEVSPTPRPTVPTVTAPAPIVTTAVITEQQEKLKKLRMEVHNRFQTDLGIGMEKRKEMLNTKFGVGSLTDLSEQQLKECKAWVEEIIEQRTVAPPVAKAPTEVEVKENRARELGFENAEEQHRLRGRLYTILTSPNQLNFKDNEAKEFLTARGFATATEIPKDKLLSLIQEANDLVKAKQTPSEF